MRKLVVMLTLAIGLVASVAVRAEAQTVGPLCFSTAPFSDQLVLFFTKTGANQYVGSGRDLATGAAVSTSLFTTGVTAVVSFVAAIPATGTGHSFMGTANASLFTGAGPGRCEAVNTTGGCGTAATFTLAAITCPATALSDTGAPIETPVPTGPLMDGSK